MSDEGGIGVGRPDVVGPVEFPVSLDVGRDGKDRLVGDSTPPRGEVLPRLAGRGAIALDTSPGVG